MHCSKNPSHVEDGSRGRGEEHHQQDTQKTKSKLKSPPTITLTVTGLNFPMKTQKLAEWMKEVSDPHCLRPTHFRSKDRLGVKDGE